MGKSKGRALVLTMLAMLLGSVFCMTIHMSIVGSQPAEPSFIDDDPEDVINKGTVERQTGFDFIDLRRCSVNETLSTLEFELHVDGTIDYALASGLSYAVLLSANSTSEDFYLPYQFRWKGSDLKADTIYYITYIYGDHRWEIKKEICVLPNWEEQNTKASWGNWTYQYETTTRTVINFSVPLAEIPIFNISEQPSLQWGAIACTSANLDYTLLEEYDQQPWKLSISGVFQPVQVVWQDDGVSNDMEKLSEAPQVWHAGVPMVAYKYISLWGYPYSDRRQIKFTVESKFPEEKEFYLRFYLEEAGVSDFHEWKQIYLEKFKVPGRGKTIASINAPIDKHGLSPLFLIKEGKASIIVLAQGDAMDWEPVLSRAPVVVLFDVVKTKDLKIYYVPIRLRDPSGNIIQPVDAATAKAHAEKATEFIRGTYPISDRQKDYWNVTEPLEIDVSKIVGRLENKVAYILDALIGHSTLGKTQASAFFPSFTRVVGLVPDRYTYWSRVWLGGNWPGVGMGSDKESVIVVDGYWTTTAHEIAHTFGLWAEGREEYDVPGQSNGRSAPGYWLNKRSERTTTDTCFMGRASVGKSYMNYDTEWIDKVDYKDLISKFNRPDPETMLVSGLIWKNGTVQLSNWYRFPIGVTDISTDATGDYSLRFLNKDGFETVGTRIRFNVTFTVLADPPSETDVTLFAFYVPYVTGTDRVQILNSTSHVLAERMITRNFPDVRIISPNGGEILNKTLNTITWTGSDRDNDRLTYIVGYSNDGGETWIPIAVSLTTTTYDWNTSTLVTGTNYKIKVLATDGANTGYDVSDNVFSITSGIEVLNASISKAVTNDTITYFAATVFNGLAQESTFDVSAYYDDTLIETKRVSEVAPVDSRIVTFRWNTTVAPLGKYVISFLMPPDYRYVAGNVSEVPRGEVNPDGIINILDISLAATAFGSSTIKEDINRDGIVDEIDAAIVGWAFGTILGNSNWNPEADLNGDAKIDSTDVFEVGLKLGQRSHGKWNQHADTNNDGKVNIIDISTIALSWMHRYPWSNP